MFFFSKKTFHRKKKVLIKETLHLKEITNMRHKICSSIKNKNIIVMED